MEHLHLRLRQDERSGDNAGTTATATVSPALPPTFREVNAVGERSVFGVAKTNNTTTATVTSIAVTTERSPHQKQPEQRHANFAALRRSRRKTHARVPACFVAVACAAITVSAFFLLNFAPSLYHRVTRSIARTELSKLVVGGSVAQDASDQNRMVEQGLRRVATSESDVRWMDENEISNVVRSGANFMDVTDGDLDNLSTDSTPKAYAITANMSTSSLQAWFSNFTTTFKDRSYRSSAGSDASDWVFNQILDVSLSRPGRLRSTTQVEVKSFRHAWPQASVIARVDGQAGAAWELPAVILAAHIDSVGDSDAQSAPIEFHWYAGHAGGLLGSQKVASEYRRAGKPVLGVLAVEPRVGLAERSTEDPILDTPLARFLNRVVEDSQGEPWVDAECGFTEKVENPPANILRFAKLAVAFAVELSLF
ncbi:hypothetical protein DFJ73DRAFT_963454 [Zopfochytrium polystomum]|nr:hypothetical protein DFJ73DRAFT_963454 [Zopfochytrium polystomum]